MVNLKKMFDPKNIAFVCTNPAESPAERTVLANLVEPGTRRIFPVNPTGRKTPGIECRASLSAIDEHIDLAVLMVPDEAILETLEQCGENGIEGAIILTAGPKSPVEKFGAIRKGLAEIRSRYRMRLIGPGSSGIILPNIRLNASFLKNPTPGNTAFICQGGNLGNAIFYWGINNSIGFSMFASLGSSLDMDFADVIDVLQEDYLTKSIMLYMDRVEDARKFLSASRCFARTKPIIVLKPGRHPQTTKDIASPKGNDAVYDAAFRRAGLVRVRETRDFYDTARILVSRSLPKGPGLAVITNSGGLGLIACDIVSELNGQLAAFSDQTIEGLKEANLPDWPPDNPVDLSGDADVKKYCGVMEACIKDAAVDGLIVIYAPEPDCNPKEMGKELARVAQKTAKPTIVVWMGADNANEGALVLKEAGIPVYDVPEDAARAYMYMANYTRNIRLLNETPEELPENEKRLSNHLKAIIHNAARDEREFITGKEAFSFLQNYGIPVLGASQKDAQPGIAAGEEWALRSMKDVDFGTVVLLISMNSQEGPNARGFAVGLPPLNQVLAKHLMEEARFSYANKETAVNMQNLIVKFSNLVADFPEIREIEIETVAMPDNKVYAANAAIYVDGAYKKNAGQYPHLAIMPYPSRYITRWKLRDGTPVTIRPIRAEDEPLLREMMPDFSEETLRVRFFIVPTEVTHMMLMKLCNVDYDREMAMVVEVTEDGKRKIIGGGRLIVEPDTQSGQFALLMLDSVQKQGLGEKMLDVLIGIAQDKHLREIYGIVLSENSKMLGLAARMGFKSQRLPDGITRVSLELE